MSQIFLVFLALLQVGTVRVVNTNNVSLKNMTLMVPLSLNVRVMEKTSVSEAISAIANFEEYIHGGIMPRNGMEIIVVAEKMEVKTPEEAIKKDFGVFGKVKVQKSQVEVAKQRAIKISVKDDFLKINEVAIYLVYNDTTYKFFLTYYIGNPQAKTYQGIFNGMLRSVKFTQ